MTLSVPDRDRMASASSDWGIVANNARFAGRRAAAGVRARTGVVCAGDEVLDFRAYADAR